MPEIPSDLQLFVFTAVKAMAKEIREEQDKQIEPLKKGMTMLLEEYNSNKGVRSFFGKAGWVVGPLLGALAQHYLNFK